VHIDRLIETLSGWLVLLREATVIDRNNGGTLIGGTGADIVPPCHASRAILLGTLCMVGLSLHVCSGLVELCR
jgi:hypothetical protein